MTDVVRGDGFIAVFGGWVGIPQLFIIVNVYAPHDLVRKRALWDDLTRLRLSSLMGFVSS